MERIPLHSDGIIITLKMATIIFNDKNSDNILFKTVLLTISKQEMTGWGLMLSSQTFKRVKHLSLYLTHFLQCH